MQNIMKTTFKQFLIESTKSHLQSLADRIGIPINELKKLGDAEIKTILKDIGKHDFAPINKFDKKELKLGIATEKEHTSSVLVATLIAKDHLMELPNYYSKLKKMEKE